MYTLKLTANQYELLEQIVCQIFHMENDKRPFINSMDNLKKIIPIPKGMEDKVENTVNEFKGRFNILFDLHTAILDLTPDNPSIKEEMPPIPEAIIQSESSTLNLYSGDKSRLTKVFGILSSYHTLLNLEAIRVDRSTQSTQDTIAEVREARDYIWTLSSSI